MTVQGDRQNCPQKKPEGLTHQERMAVSIVTGPDGAHATPELSDGDLPVGHDVCEVGAHLWGKKTTMHRDQRKQCAVVTFWMAAPRCEGPKHPQPVTTAQAELSLPRKAAFWDFRPTSTVEMGPESDNGMSLLGRERKVPSGRWASGTLHSEVQWREFLCRRQYPAH